MTHSGACLILFLITLSRLPILLTSFISLCTCIFGVFACLSFSLLFFFLTFLVVFFLLFLITALTTVLATHIVDLLFWFSAMSLVVATPGTQQLPVKIEIESPIMFRRFSYQVPGCVSKLLNFSDSNYCRPLLAREKFYLIANNSSCCFGCKMEKAWLS